MLISFLRCSAPRDPRRRGAEPFPGNVGPPAYPEVMSSQKLWAAVALVGILVAAVVALDALGRDTTPLQTIITAVLAGLGALLYQKVDNVETRVNGTQSKLIDAAINSQPPPIPPATETVSENDESKPR